MKSYTKEELEEALTAISSLLGKCEKALPKLTGSQKTLMERRVKALAIARELVGREGK